MRWFRQSVLLVATLCVFCSCGESSKAKAAVEKRPAAVEATSVPDAAIPPKSEWKARSSANQLPHELLPHEAIDDNQSTRWSSPNSEPNWLEIDFGSIVDIFGCTIHWETAYASAYNIEVSEDGESWKRVYATDDGDGGTDEVFFQKTAARFLRINATKRGTSHWGFSIFEVDVKGEDEQVRVVVEGQSEADAARAFDGTSGTVWQSPVGGACVIDVDLRGEMDLGGVWIKWGDNFATKASLLTSKDGEHWDKAVCMRDGTGGKDMLLHPGRRGRYLRLDIEEASADGPVQIKDMALCSPGQHKNSLFKYNFVAKKHRRGIYPLQFLGEQVYWTLVGIPGDTAESLFDEYGNFEPRMKSSSLQPYLQVDGELVSASDAPVLEHNMESGHLPLPRVKWHTKPISLVIRALALGKEPKSASYVLYTLKNETEQVQQGRFLLTIRPVQINPSWQFGGISPIESLQYRALPEGLGVVINGALQYVALTPPSGMVVRAFEQGDIIEDLLRNRFPQGDGLANAGEEISGALAYDLDLAPGEEKSVLIAAPLHESAENIEKFARKLKGDPSQAKRVFDAVHVNVARHWRDILDRVKIEIPEQRLVDIAKAQIAYIMINRDGPAIQPGSRNYKRAFMRDGCLTSGALLRMGLTQEVREYLDWYSERVDDEGWVPPILNNDGTINKGFGWNNEYDSQGEYLFAMMQYYQFTKDRSLIVKHFDAIEGAMQFLVHLREQTLVPGYMADEEAPERFAGILPKSISHEGYNPPVHSYWDLLFALKGLKDGAEMARLAGRNDVARWAREQYQVFRKSMQRSMKATIAWKGIDYVPACAEYGDCDPTSTAIAFFPCGESDILPHEYMRKTYENYYDQFSIRLRPGWHGYTPYEVRVIPALVDLGQKNQAKQVLDSITSHCRPRGWKHLAEVVFNEVRNGSYMGDMPHTWVGSAIVNSLRYMLVHEAGNKLVLLKGAPDDWVEGDGIHIQNLPTHFGDFDMRARMKNNTLGVKLGGSAAPKDGFIFFWPATKGEPKEVLVNGEPWNRFDPSSVLVPAKTKTITIRWDR